MSRVPRIRLTPSRQKQTRTRLFRRLSTALALSLAALLSLTTLGVSARLRSQSTDSEETLATVTSQSSAKARSAKTEFVPGDILVRYRDNAKARREEMADTPLRKHGREIPVKVERFEGSDLVAGLRHARVPPEDTLDAIAALKTDPEVLYAEPNYIRHKNNLPVDAHFSDLWALKNTGQSGNVNSGLVNGTPGADIDAELAWNITTGSSNVVVGIIDTGIDINHTDLAGNIWVNPGEIAGNNIDDDNNGKIDDVNGWDFANNDKTVYDGGSSDPDDHGTHVAGTIGAKGNNGIGVTGINWNVKLMPLKFLHGADGAGSDSDAIAAFNYAKMMHDRGVNIRIINCSWGGVDFNSALYDAIWSVGQSGILVVAAAGNEASDSDDFPHYPASYSLPNLIRVSATDRIDDLTNFSNFGTLLPNIGAPGRGILSTTPRNYPDATYTDPDGSSYTFFGGTSMAAPQVSGVAALILAQYPSISLPRLRSALLYSGEPIPTLAGKVLSGRRLNAYLALLNAGINDPTSPIISGLNVASQNGRFITLQFNATDDGTIAALYDLTFTSTSAVEYHLGSFVPSSLINPQSVTVEIPYRQTAGTITLSVTDKAGNNSTMGIGVSVNAAASEPYIVSLSPSSPLSTGGDALSLIGDDKYRLNYALPFDFPFFGKLMKTVTISTNGALYFSSPPERESGDADDVPDTTAGLNLQNMIAGMWDDLRTDKLNGDVFVVRPDANRIIFRWQGSTFANSAQPINFEIELQRNGTIQTRYGSGNAGLKPVVGISKGEADISSINATNAYVVNSHTSPSAVISLANAQTVTFTQASTVPTLQFSQSSYILPEGSGSILVNVERTGDTNSAVTASYATTDLAGLQNCNVINGIASSRCDYVTSVGTLRFAAGETSKSIPLIGVNDVFVEGPEKFVITLSSPTGGAVLGGTGIASVAISDNDAGGAVNPINDTAFFVRQHYIDFLNREPDPQGFQDWQNILNNCPPGNTTCDRIEVSSGFFRSPEFRERGYFPYRFYSVSLGRKPSYAEFIPDLASVSGFLSPAEQEQAKQAFIASFMSRPEFTAIYNGLTNNAYVQRLFDTAGVAQVTVSGVVYNVALMQQAMAGGKTRAQVLREMVESPEVDAKYYTQAFVVMQYFGYLRRDPDALYQQLINQMNQNPQNYRQMVNIFVNSAEYRARFGP